MPRNRVNRYDVAHILEMRVEGMAAFALNLENET